MLKLWWASICAAFSIAAATATDPAIIAPHEAIEKFGGFAVSDGSSYFSFLKDGTFASGPLGESGRTMSGRWTKDKDGRLVATAKLGWVNGLNAAVPDYRRVVFHVAYLKKRTEPISATPGQSAEIFESYFLIDQMTSIPPPAEEIEK